MSFTTIEQAGNNVVEIVNSVNILGGKRGARLQSDNSVTVEYSAGFGVIVTLTVHFLMDFERRYNDENGDVLVPAEIEVSIGTSSAQRSLAGSVTLASILTQVNALAAYIQSVIPRMKPVMVLQK